MTKKIDLILPVAVMGMALLAGCEPQKHTAIDYDEHASRTYREIRHGIPAYDAKEYAYRRDGKSVGVVSFADPRVVAVATEPMKWGFFQFPQLTRTLDGDLLAVWNMKDDAIHAYGKAGRDSAMSYDGGKTWVRATGAPGKEVQLPGGDQLVIYRPAALDTATLKLPHALATRSAYRGAKSSPFTFYRVAELPPRLQGVYFQRLRKGERTWAIEQGQLNDPRLVRYSRGGLLPVVWAGDMKVLPDGSLIAGVYPGFVDEPDGSVKPSGTHFYTSRDEGKSWEFLSRIPYAPDTTQDVNGAKREALGFTEPALEILSDGTFLCVQRTTDGMGDSPMYISRSSDQGKTWTKPEVMASSGVMPKLLQLENGVIALAAGRPGVQLRFSFDNGQAWTDPFEMLPWEGEGRPSCGYTELLATGPDSFLIIYSDFKVKNERGEDRKAIKVREVTVKGE